MQTSGLPAAGDLREPIAIFLWHDVPNSSQGLTKVLDELVRVRAKVESVRSLKMRAGMQEGEMPTHLFFIRRATKLSAESITVDMQIHWKGRAYRVKDAISLGQPAVFTQISAVDIGLISEVANG